MIQVCACCLFNVTTSKSWYPNCAGRALLRGGRGQPPVNIEHLADSIFRISQVAQGLQGHLETLEINPLLLHGSSIEVLDALMTWKQ